MKRDFKSHIFVKRKYIKDEKSYLKTWNIEIKVVKTETVEK